MDTQPSSSSHLEFPPTPVARRFPFITFLACAACVVVFLGLQIEPDNETWPALRKWGYYPPDEIWSGAYWALVTSVFVHLAAWHMAFNVYWLFVLGTRMERAIGSLPFAAFFLASAIFSSAAEFAFSGTTGIGASGVAYALFGFMWLNRNRVKEFRDVLTPKLVSWFFIWLVGCVVATLTGVWEVGNAAHIGGLLFGAGIALRPVCPARRKLITSALSVAGVVSLVPLFWAPWSFEWTSVQALRAHEKADIATAIKWYRRSMELGQDKAWCLSSMGVLYAWQGDHAAYRQTLDELRRIDPAEATHLEKEAADYLQPLEQKTK
ncbi:MAG TPA: rhomboid family intramembrane serine protease [Verrucomicrobiae bacterium]|nr:rhomboid family intramembrane serine protease [Verrucomicrobiae bacterium]